MGKFIDLTGKRFGKLQAIFRSFMKDHRSYWLCKCDCGKECIVYIGSLQRGLTKSCGDNIHRIGINRTHGLSDTRIYDIWLGMIKRCTNPNASGYYKYGARGIKIEDSRWFKFENFYADMKNGYRDNLTLERMDNSKGYFKENCKWATLTEQGRNKRNNRLVTFNNKTQTVSQWAQELQMNYFTLYNRLYTCNWSIEKAFTKPII